MIAKSAQDCWDAFPMEAIVTFIKPDDKPWADIQKFSLLPRVGELFNINDFSHEWWRITDVIHTDRRHEDGPPISLVAVQCEPHPVAIRRKSETRDG